MSCGGGEQRVALPASLSDLPPSGSFGEIRRRTSRSAAGFRWFAPFLLHQDYGGQVGRKNSGELLFGLFEVAL
jgi:hypothetical protein